MITLEQARGLALHYLGKLEAESRRVKDLRKDLSTDERDVLGFPDEDAILRLAIVEEKTIERDFGWVFFWQTAQYLENRDLSCALAGNAPLLIAREDGSLHVLGTAEPVEHYIETFERFGDPHG